MTRDEAIKIINCYDIGFYDLSGEKIPADKLVEAFDMAIEALDERKVELFDDGTLVVNVKEGEKVGRVLICGDDHFGGLYYIDAEPVVHGYWTVDKKHTEEIYTNPVYCSVCGKDVVMDYGEYAQYCPCCGAKMDKD